MSQLDIFKGIPQTKAEINNYSKIIKDQFLSGENENLLQFKALKVFESIIKQSLADKDIKKSVLNAAEKHGKSAELYNSEFTVCEAGVKYDYSNCNDDIYDQLVKEYNEIGELIKQREEFLKSIGDNEVYNEHGVKLNKPLKTSETIVKIKIK